MTANSTGKQFEHRCVSLLENNRDYVNTKVNVKISDKKRYKPDAVTDTELFEFKYQQVSGSVVNKLTQAVIELQLMSEMTELKSYLVYNGKELARFVEYDPAFNKAMSICPDVTLFTFEQFHDHITSSSDCINRQQEGYMEHTATCVV